MDEETSKPDRNATHQERTMFNLRTSLLALAAVATVATAFVTSTSSADARGGMGGFRSGGFHGGMGGFRHGGMGGFRHGGMGFRHAGLHHRPHFHHRPHWHHRHHRFVRWHRPWIYGVGAAAIAAPVYASAPVYAVAPRPVVAAPNPCTCLSKEYTQDGMVVFQDRCTNEAAAAQIGGQQQTQVQPGVAAPQ